MKIFKEDPRQKSVIADIIIILIFSFIIGAADYYWNALAYYPPYGDYTLHFMEAAAFHNAMERSQSLSSILTAWIWPSQYPAGMYLISHIYMLFAGSGFKQMMQSQLLLIPISVASLYYIVRPRLGVIAGIAAILGAAIIPETFLNTDHYILDHAQAAFVLLAMCLLVNFRHFNSRFQSISIGAVIGIGTLFKYTVFSFLLLPFFFAALTALRECREKISKSAIVLHALCFIAAFSIPYATGKYFSGPEYFNRLREIELGGTIFSKTSLELLVLTIFCWIIWLAAIAVLRKRGEVLANIFSAPAAAYIICIPWFICNTPIVGDRQSVLSRMLSEQMNSAYVKELLHEHYMIFLHWSYFVIFCACIIFILTKYGKIEERLIGISLLALPPTSMTLGIAVRYVEACFILSAVLITMVLCRIRLGQYIALTLAFIIFLFNTCLTVQEGVATACGINTNDTWMRHAAYYIGWQGFNHNMPKSNFDMGVELAPKICVPNRPSLVLVDYVPQGNFCLDFYTGLQAWSELNNFHIVPVLIIPEENKYMVNFQESFTSIALGLKDKFPELLDIQGQKRYEDNFDDKLPGERTDFIIALAKCTDSINMKELKINIEEKLGKNAYEYSQGSDDSLLYIWRRPNI